jgi:hypothetical protein
MAAILGRAGCWNAFYDRTMKTRLNCPCGTAISGTDEDDLVAKVQEHLSAEHPDHEYDRDQILFMAY